MKETEQTLLEKIQNDVAEEKVHVLWEDLTPIGRSRCWPIVCERYYQAKVKASCEATLKKASENAKHIIVPPYTLDKSSITDPSNIVIL